MKKILSIILCITMILGLSSVAFAEHYSNFTDVKPESWYYEDVDNAVRLGIINGKSETTFAPDDNLTYAEAIKLAACMYQLYKDGQVLIVSTGSPWYQTYVDYARDHGIITDNFFLKVSDINEKATRAGYIEIFANALPDEALAEINNVPDGSIPDVPMVHESAIGIYKLYRAGILTGVDAAHNCKPEDNIKRCEVAAIITRMMNENERVKFNMGKDVPEENPDEPKETPEEKPEEQPDEPIEDDSEVKETADMYPELVIASQPEYVHSADEGEIINYIVAVSGGKKPYTYQWYTRGARYGDTPVEENDSVKGADTPTLKFTYGVGNGYSDSKFYCLVTDALGSTVKSDTIKAPEAIFLAIPEAQKTDYDGGYIIPARVYSGSIKSGQQVILYVKALDIFCIATVEKIEMFGKTLDEASVNDRAGLLFKDMSPLTDKDFPSQYYSNKFSQQLQGMDSYVVKLPLTAGIMESPRANVGAEAKFTASFWGGRAPYTYTWQISSAGENKFDPISETSNSLLSGFGTNSLTIASVVSSFYNLEWRCVVTDADGNVAYPSKPSVIIPTTGIYVSKQPVDVKVNYGETAIFSTEGVTPMNAGVASYQWQIKTDNHKDFVNIEKYDSWAKDADTKELKIFVESSDFRSHTRVRCVITSTSGDKVITKEASILPKSVYITYDPENVVARDGEVVSFEVYAEGGQEPYTYAWEYTYPALEGGYLPVSKDSAYMEGYNTRSLYVYVKGDELNSDYKFRCVVTDATGRKVTSKYAYIIVSADATVDFKQGGSSKDQMIVIMP